MTRKEGGFYQCHATNQEGQGSSQTVKLPIKCKYYIFFAGLDHSVVKILKKKCNLVKKKFVKT